MADAETKEEKKRIEKILEEAKEKVKLLREADGREVDKEKESDKTTIVEDWRNEVEPVRDYKINSPFLTVPIDKDDDEKEIDEKVEKYIADYNEKEEEADESNDVEEEEEESDDDKSEDDEQEEDEPEEENSDSE